MAVKNSIPSGVNRKLLDRLIAGKETKTNDKQTILWWFSLSTPQREAVKIERSSERFADKYDKSVGSFAFVLLIIGGIYLFRSYSTDMFVNILLMVLNVILSLVISLVLMKLANVLLYRFKYNKLKGRSSGGVGEK